MLNKIFELKLVKDAFSNDVVKPKYKLAAEIYLKNEIEIKETSPISISCIVDNKKVDIKLDVVLTYYVNGKKTKKDEYVLACLLAFKRNYIVNNDPKFNIKELIVENNYYNNTYVTFFNIDEYTLRIHFYIGLVNKLFELDMKQECLEYIVDFYYEIYNNFTFDNRYGDLKYYFKYQIIRNKHQLIFNNNQLVIDLINKKTNSIAMLADIINIIGINFPDVFKNKNAMFIYEYIFKTITKLQKESPVFKSLETHKKIVQWYNGDINEDFMRNYISKPEVRYCYIKHLSENKRYKDICELIKPTTFNIVNQEINFLITKAFYECEDYEGAINIFNRFNSVSYERYLNYKENFPILFQNPYLDSIISFIVENYEDDDVQNIIINEKLDKYQIYVLAKDDFDILDKRFGDFVGKYDDLLIKIYQKEIIKTIDGLKGKYNYIPEPILKKFEKMKKIKNGKYYVAETIYYILETYYISYSKELRKYLSLLGV